MKALLFGSNGRVGKELVKKLGAQYELSMLPREAIDLAKEPQRIAPMIKDFAPQLIINATACNGPEACFDAPGTAFAVNTSAVAAMAAAARDIGALFVHYSTDYVFSDANSPLEEDHDIDPINIYGASKAAGEFAIQHIAPYHFIFRLSSVYGADLGGPINALLQVQDGKGTPENPVKVLRQLCCPISAGKVAELTDHAVTAAFTHMNWRLLSGIYHMVPAGAVWKSDFARHALKLRGYGDSITIVEGTLSQPRPQYIPLNGQKFYSYFGVKPWHPYEDLNTMLAPTTQPLFQEGPHALQ